MARVARRVHDKQVLRLIRRYLEAGVMDGGLVAASEEGTPQGSPLSPLLSNVMLDDLDWELDRRGHRFVRFADDGRIYVSSERAGQRVMASITQYIEQRLKLQRQPTEVGGRPSDERPLLGFQFFRYRDGTIGVTVAPKALKRAQERIRQLTTRTGASRWSGGSRRSTASRSDGRLLRVCRHPSPFEELEKRLRRLRQVRWKEWKRPQSAATCARGDPRPRRPLMGGLAEGVLARRRLSTPDRPAERLLAQDHGPERIHRSLPPFQGC